MRVAHESAVGFGQTAARWIWVRAGYSLALFGLGLVGCQPEMPMPPPRQSTNPQEDSFYWAMERMEHAVEMFRPSSDLGLHVKQTMKYKLFPPTEGKPDYTALVTITTKSIYNHEPIPGAKERKKAQKEKARKEALELGLDDPFGTSSEERLTKDPLAMDEPGSVKMGSPDVADPDIPATEVTENKEYQLVYVDDQWKLQTESVEEHEQMWFDYALQQGEFAPSDSKL